MSPTTEPIIHTSTLPRPLRRLRTAAAVGTASVALAGALAACGDVETKLDARSAVQTLKDAKSASFTFRLDDPKGELASLAESDEDRTTAKAVTGSALRVVVDPAGDTSIGDASAKPAGGAKDVAAALRAGGSTEIAYVNGGSDVVVIRLVSGKAYAKVDMAAVRRISGEELPTSSLAPEGAPEAFRTVVDGLEAGKWLTLDVAAAYDRVAKTGLLGASGTTPDPTTSTAFAKDLLAAVKANSVTSEKGSGDDLTIGVEVKAKAALTAALDVVAKPQYASLLQVPGGAQLTKGIAEAKAQIAKLPDSPVTGTITVKDGHITQAALDLASVVALGDEADVKAKVKTARVVVDVDDTVDAVAVPGADEVVQLDPLLDLALAGVSGSAGGS